MIFLCLSRETGDQRGAKNDIRDLFSKCGYDIDQLLLWRYVFPSVSGSYRSHAGSADPDNDRFSSHLGSPRSVPDKFLPDNSTEYGSRRMPGILHSSFNKQVQRFLTVKICSVDCSLLRYQNQFLDALFCQLFCLLDQELSIGTLR